jgi:uncharacterized protein
MFAILIISFNLGLFSTLHCVGMCGGILTAMMFAQPDAESNNKLKTFNRSLAYNIGRISSYSIAGLISGLLGLKIIGLSEEGNAHLILQCIAAIVLIALALNILGVLPYKKFVEALGMKLWQHIQPLGKHLLPINTLSRTFLFGMLWGWLPCGLVYSALLLSLSSGSALNGMLTMLFFGLGTLPGMLSAGYFSNYLNQLKSNNKIKIITAVLMILIAISLPLSTVYFAQHHNHSGTEHSLHQHH